MVWKVFQNEFDWFKIWFNAPGAKIFPFSYFENPWLQYDKVIEDIINANIIIQS